MRNRIVLLSLALALATPARAACPPGVPCVPADQVHIDTLDKSLESAVTDGDLAGGSQGTGLPAGGTVGYYIRNTAPGVGVWANPSGLTAGTASALAADPLDCSAGFVALGVNAAGVANCAAESTVDAGTAAALASNPSACSTGQYVSDVAADGTLTCGTPPGGGIASVSADPAPALGGNLAAGARTITGTGAISMGDATFTSVTIPQHPSQGGHSIYLEAGTFGDDGILFGVHDTADLADGIKDCTFDADGKLGQDCFDLSPSFNVFNTAKTFSIQMGVLDGLTLNRDCRFGTNGKMPVACVEAQLGSGDVTGSSPPGYTAPAGVAPEQVRKAMAYFTDANGKDIAADYDVTMQTASKANATLDRGAGFFLTGPYEPVGPPVLAGSLFGIYAPPMTAAAGKTQTFANTNGIVAASNSTTAARYTFVSTATRRTGQTACIPATGNANSAGMPTCMPNSVWVWDPAGADGSTITFMRYACGSDVGADGLMISVSCY